jgi:hypothetical protein
MVSQLGLTRSKGKVSQAGKTSTGRHGYDNRVTAGRVGQARYGKGPGRFGDGNHRRRRTGDVGEGVVLAEQRQQRAQAHPSKVGQTRGLPGPPVAHICLISLID